MHLCSLNDLSWILTALTPYRGEILFLYILVFFPLMKVLTSIFFIVGIQTVPRVVSLDSNGRQLVQWPVKELESLRRKQRRLRDIELKTGGLVEVKGLKVSEACAIADVTFISIMYMLFAFKFIDNFPN